MGAVSLSFDAPDLIFIVHVSSSPPVGCFWSAGRELWIQQHGGSMSGFQESYVCSEESALGGAVPGGYAGPALLGAAHQESDWGKAPSANRVQLIWQRSICITWSHETTVLSLALQFDLDYIDWKCKGFQKHNHISRELSNPSLCAYGK